ncbi:MAG: S1 RNA-binding domain-containing protein [Myxococcota bacterium]|jgi:tetratricopeptide (TPR) repeat protein|nr:S1 RNA-binding domain-containing protein [Myxococcota bacterium]
MTEQRTHQDPTPEILNLMEMATQFPPMAVPLAELAFKIGLAELGERIVRMGLDGPRPGIEFFFVSANAARRQGQFQRTRELVAEALQRFVEMLEDGENELDEEGQRLLHLIRLGMATLVFDEKDPHADPDFIEALRTDLPRLDPIFAADPFYRTLLAQTYWFSSREKSEREWDNAIELDESELAWNARGTWYKDAERSLDDAEDAYRAGLEAHPESSLLMHNLAQVLIARAEQGGFERPVLRRLLTDTDALLLRALRGDSPRGLRRHIHETREGLDRLWTAFRSEEGADERPRHDRQGGRRRGEHPKLPAVGDVVVGTVSSIPRYGVFIKLPAGGVGLLHKSEMAQEEVDDPAQFVQIGDELSVEVIAIVSGDGKRPRISLSQRSRQARES